MLSHMGLLSVTSEARLRARNQLTLPEPVVHAAGILEGDRFVVEVDPADPDTVRLHRIRSSYAGALKLEFDDPAEALESERTSWASA
jgi:bifunctional DNA-binding transcriptional regulator/antitoxin component of YhaV-PrlF toxin-antitoxin module